MANINNIREVANKQIYESYLGILRISPFINEFGAIEDDTNSILNDTSKSIRLSDSSGNYLAIEFKPTSFQGSINISTHLISGLKVKKNLSIRSTLHITNTQNDYPISFKESYSFSHENSTILNYPKNSPYDNTYFNNPFNILIPYDNTKYPSPEECLKEELYKKPLEWYKTNEGILMAHYVFVNDKQIFTPNIHEDLVPVLNHNNKILIARKGDVIIDSKTSLSWTDLDTLVWNRLSYVTSGNVRHSRGRYTDLGYGIEGDPNKTLPFYGIKNAITRGDNYLGNAPMMGTGSFPPSTITYSAIPLKDIKFFMDRQISGKTKKGDNFFTKKIAREYIFCNGDRISKEIYKNIPSDYILPDIFNTVTHTPSLLKTFKDGESPYFRFLRTLNWTPTENSTHDISKRNNPSPDASYEIKYFPEKTYLFDTSKPITKNTIYKSDYDIRMTNEFSHHHNSFSNMSGNNSNVTEIYKIFARRNDFKKYCNFFNNDYILFNPSDDRNKYYLKQGENVVESNSSEDWINFSSKPYSRINTTEFGTTFIRNCGLFGYSNSTDIAKIYNLRGKPLPQDQNVTINSGNIYRLNEYEQMSPISYNGGGRNLGILEIWQYCVHTATKVFGKRVNNKRTYHDVPDGYQNGSYRIQRCPTTPPIQLINRGYTSLAINHYSDLGKDYNDPNRLENPSIAINRSSNEPYPSSINLTPLMKI